MLRSVAYVLQRYMLRRRYLVARAGAVDLRVRFEAADVVGRHIYKYGGHEPALTAFLLRSLRLDEGDVFVDVGAHIGWYSLLVARHQPQRVRVVAFEPDPDSFVLLRENLALNGLAHVEAHRLAVSDTCGARPLFRYSAKNTGRHSLLPINEGEVVEVETTTLSQFCEYANIDARRVRLLKIDVEGNEAAVLRGMADLLPLVPAILAEYSPQYMRRGGIERREYLDPLFDTGFTPYSIEADRLQPLERHALERLEVNRNFLWLNARERSRWPLDAVAARLIAAPQSGDG